MPITAWYGGDCMACDAPINPGQMVTRIAFREGLGYKHVVCPTPHRPPVCKVCFQEKSVNGICACNE